MMKSTGFFNFFNSFPQFLSFHLCFLTFVLKKVYTLFLILQQTGTFDNKSKMIFYKTLINMYL